MTAVLLSIHVLAAILVVGPIAVAASLFPRYATPERAAGAGAADRGPAALLHRICRVYALIGIVVPVFGVATGAQLGVLGDYWLIVSVVLTAAAAGVLGFAMLPDQRRMLDAWDSAGDGTARIARRLTMLTGVFNLLWAVVVVLMIVRPGSTTGV